MNKLMKKILFAFSFLFCFLFTNEIKALETVDYRYIDGVFFEQVFHDGTNYISYKAPMYSVNGKNAYCIEPGAEITTLQYNIGDWNVTNLTYDQKHYIELVGYYGYDYPTHRGNTKYYIAAQELIWKAVKNVDVKWTTAINGNGDIVDISKEKNEILSLIAGHSVKPSFNATTKNVVIGDNLTLTDTNGVLSGFDIYSSGNQTASIDGNNLNIKINTTGDDQIKLVKGAYDNEVTLVYYSQTSQKLASLRISDPEISLLNIKSVAGKVKINKTDKQTDKGEPQGDATLEGAKYNIYKENGTYVTSITTDKNGMATSMNLSELGRYYLQEEKASTGYQLDSTKYYFEMTKDNLYPTIKVYEKVINRTFEFTKVYSNANTGIMTPEANVMFGFFNSKGELYKTAITDKNGRINVNLVYGKYIVKQLTSTHNYEKINDFEIEVKELGDTIYKVISNAEVTAKLKVIKVDKDTGDIITKSGIKFKIFNIDKNEYVSQTITYPTPITLDEFVTNADGILITPYPLSNGHYRLEEVDQVINGYLWNKESIEFEISEESEFINGEEYGILLEIKFENKEVKGKIDITKYGEQVVIENNSFKYETIKLENVIYGVYASEDIYSANKVLMYKKDSLIGKITTDKDGIGTLENLYLGKYYLLEEKSSNNNMVDKTKHYFELKYKDQYTEIVTTSIELKNYLAKSDLEFSKTDLTTGKGIANTKVEIMTEACESIFIGYTDSKGNIKIKNLFVGKFFIIEREASTGYKLSDEKVYFEIKENGKIVKANMTNEKIKGTLEFTKTDISTSEPLPETLIEIYEVNTNRLVFSGRTDKDGRIVINNIEYGDYYLLEKEAPKGYILNPSKMFFSIKEDGEIVKCNMTNEKEIVKVPSTFTKANKMLDIVSIIIILFGLGYLLYGYKKEK